MDADSSAAPKLVGRRAELGRLRAMFARAAEGVPGVLFVHGEAGVGKTALVREACRSFQGEVLWGTCVHFGTVSVPFAAVSTALGRWLSGVGEEERSEVLHGLDALDVLFPSVVAAPSRAKDAGGGLGLLLPQLDNAINRVAQRGPTVVVVDDLQWADPSSLDLIAFLVTGLASQRLAVVATVRDEDRPEGHVLNGWLADRRRLPCVAELRLERLDLMATTEQVHALTGARAAGDGFAAEAFSRSGGNPYLTELLVNAGAEPKSGASSVPVALREALLARWHGLSAEARDTSRLLALGGRPVDLDNLVAVADALAPAWDLRSNLRLGVAEGVHAGVVCVVEGGDLWFRHPLLAEVLAADLPGRDARSIHAAYASVFAGTSRARSGDVALHHELAGNMSEALEWSLVAAESTAAVQGATEHLEHLERACRLWPSVDRMADREEDYIQLLLRTSRAAQGITRMERALALVDQALAITDAGSDPATACRLLALKHRFLQATGHLPWTSVTPALREALVLAESLPGTTERVIADSMLAFAEHWAGHLQARSLAASALRTARQIGEPDALIPALIVNAQVFEESEQSFGWLEEAYSLAAVSGDVFEMLDAAIGIGNLYEIHGDYVQAIDSHLRRGADLVQVGAPPAGRFLFAVAGALCLMLGRWAEAANHLRPSLASSDGGHHEAAARTTMAILCVRRGDVEEAERHLARAAQTSSTEYRGTASFPYGQVELLLAQARPAAALQIIEAQVEASTLADPRDADEFLLQAARAAADLARQGRDELAPDPLGYAEALLSRVNAAWSRMASQPFLIRGPADTSQLARQALYEAELGRLRELPGQPQRWSLARHACQQAGLLWEEGWAACRQGQATLSEGGTKSEAAEAFRDALTIGRQLGAVPLCQEVQRTAGAAHIAVEELPISGRTLSPSSPLSKLTKREREVLTFVIAGRSNAEIAKSLFLSEKTVSTHISNILRKTGTTSRVEAAGWASRMGMQRTVIGQSSSP